MGKLVKFFIIFLTPLALAMVACDMCGAKDAIEEPQKPSENIPAQQQPGTDIPTPPAPLPSTPVLQSVSAQFTGEANKSRKEGEIINLLDIVEFKFIYDKANDGSSEMIKKFADITDTINVTITDSKDVKYIINNAENPVNYTFSAGINAFTVTGSIGDKQLTSITSSEVTVEEIREEPPTPVSTPIEGNELDVLCTIIGLSNEDVTSGENIPEIKLTAQTIKLLGDISAGSLFSDDETAGYENKYKKEYKIIEDLTEALDKVKTYYGINDSEKENLKSVISAYHNKLVSVEKGEPHELKEYGVVSEEHRYGWVDGEYEIIETYERYDDRDLWYDRWGDGNKLYDGTDIGKIIKVQTVDTYTVSGDNIVLDGDFNYNDINLRIAGNNVSFGANAKFSIENTAIHNDNRNEIDPWAVTPEVIFDIFTNLVNAPDTKAFDILISNGDYIENELLSKFKNGANGLPKFDFSVTSPVRTGADLEEYNEAEMQNTTKLIAMYKIYEGNEDKLFTLVDIPANSRHEYDGSWGDV